LVLIRIYRKKGLINLIKRQGRKKKHHLPDKQKDGGFKDRTHPMINFKE